MLKLLSSLVTLFIVNCGITSAQESFELDLIIMIDDELVFGGLARSQILIDNEDAIELSYHPGNLSFSQSDYDRLKEAKSDSLTLTFDYYDDGGKLDLCNYKIPFFKSWLDHYFIVLRIYNLDKKKYRKAFKPLDAERNYTYELDYPGGSMRRIRNE